MTRRIIRALPLLLLSPLVVSAQDADALLAASRETAGQLIQQLGAQLRAELAKGGPEGAVAVCKNMAPELAGRLSRETGWRVSRVSLKTRNPLLGSPDAWEQRGLEEFDRRVAAGEKAETLEVAEVVEEPSGRYYRYMKALPVQPLCLTCHGTAETIPPDVQQRLRVEYPNDRATGYRAGQVRGAVTVKRPL
ncbi:MAG TPA: DUF3365 domain-containing protein [Burkholderiales bacterium]|nr:DUF3365 domain-containing protein [Burkholderiales bacterium]